MSESTRSTSTYKLALGLFIGSTLFLFWANGAVGIIGSENNDINAWYFAVIAIGVIGSAAARLKPSGMSYTLFTMALAQGTIAVVALILGMHRLPGSSVPEILAVNGLFMVLFAVSAILFRQLVPVSVTVKSSS